MKVSTDIFIMGILLGWGPCLAFCAPIVVPYIAASQKGWLKGFRAALIFSVSRILPYMLLALVASSLGHLLIRRYYESRIGLSIYLLAGLFILILGILLILGKNPHWRICQILTKHTTGNSLKGIISLGLLIGFAPCIPLFGGLTYIAFVSQNFFQGLFYGACFGAGTLLSPLLLFGLVAGGLPPLILRKPVVYNIFSRLCGCLLVYFGIRLISGAVRI